MTRAQLFEEGARLPEELSRLLFLESVIAGRRVLEVGARSGAVARFLLEIGAARVVCAADDRDVVQALRTEHAASVEAARASGGGGDRARALLERFAERVDFRVIRPGMLPGDDGAFDLVIDFGLPAALAAGKTFRLTDIARLLSADGFAVTALPNNGVLGLAAFFDVRPSEKGPGAAVGAASAEPSLAPPSPGEGGHRGSGTVASPVTYRGLVEALRLQFELVQVYFQSLMLGYFFGSYDVDPKDDGIAPQTALMQGEPEPAGHYMFAFGNAVPVIEDVALVQVPFADLLAARTRTGLPGARPDPLVEGASPNADRSEQDRSEQDRSEQDRSEQGAPAAELMRLREDNAQQAHALVEVAARVAGLRSDLEALVRAVELRTAERDELATLVGDLEAALAERDVMVTSVRGELDRADARMRQLESVAASEPHIAVGGQIALEENAILREERTQLLVHLSHMEQALVDGEQRGRALEDACELALTRVQELEGAVEELESERRALVEMVQELDRGPDAELTGVVSPGAVLGRPASDAADPARTLTPEEAAAAEDLQSRGAEERARVEELQAQLADYEQELMAAADALAEERTRHDALFAEVERLRALALRADTLEQELAHLRESQAASDAERARLAARRDELEADAVRLAEGVKTLVEEREQLRARAEGAETELAGAQAEVGGLRQAHDAAVERVTALEVKDEALERRFKAASAGRDEARREAEASRAALQDVAGQRDTLKQVVAAREREQHSLKDELRAATAEVRRLQEQADAQSKLLGEARQRASVLEVERTQLKRRTDEDARTAVDAAARIAELERQLADTRSASEIEVGLRADLVQLSARAALLEASLAEARELLSTHAARGDLLHAQLEEARRAGERQQARAELVSATLGEARFQLHQERARGDIVSSTLAEARERLAHEQARADLLSAQLAEAQAAASAAAATAALFSAELEDARFTFERRRRAWEAELEASAGRRHTHVAVDEARVEIARLEQALEEVRGADVGSADVASD